MIAHQKHGEKAYEMCDILMNERDEVEKLALERGEMVGKRGSKTCGTYQQMRRSRIRLTVCEEIVDWRRSKTDIWDISMNERDEVEKLALQYVRK